MITTTHEPGHHRTATTTARPPRGPAVTFALHLGGMVLAMLLGMLLLAPVATGLAAAVGWDLAAAGPEAAALVMATTMTLGMAVWMVHRGHGPRAVGEMSAAMVLPFAAGLAPYWAGLVSAADALVVGHVLMLPAMAAVMLLRRDRYTGGHVHAPAPTAWGRGVEAVAHRWPTLLALGLTFDSWLRPGILPAWTLVVLGGEYLVIGAVRREFRGDRLLAAHVAGFVLYLGLAAVAATAPAAVAGPVVAAGWLLHVGWDAALYRAGRVTWRWFAEACAVIDLVLGVTVLLAL
ncbi:hypothetical protein [Cellulomonas shaoxiangyii]|uniref:Uncharacterized protein n=1 Tax=Cellulomonas shaoxiangyii TaxID=2566013 RepID=A0A4P7SFK2_9CELL|nr:hypothetical protein [Cellulomonas shaoxiangyii]QCB92328.1 hypothetical protein E5225_00905 [Cellulomonas shaoxiangyii]TGY86278.1 hypothetical protein E5226_02960 [Cellulomonas shaoxiangyii]